MQERETMYNFVNLSDSLTENFIWLTRVKNQTRTWIFSVLVLWWCYFKIFILFYMN